MDFLKSAVASAIANATSRLGTKIIGDKVDLDPSIWTLYNGTKRVCPMRPSFPNHTNAVPYSPLQEDGSDCSIFAFDVSDNKSSLPLARNALKKLRTLRHPGVIKVLDTVEVRYSHDNTRIVGA